MRAFSLVIAMACAVCTATLSVGVAQQTEPSHGAMELTFRSRLDGTEQRYFFFAPQRPRSRRASRAPSLPLLVTLHGFGGNAGDYFRETFGIRRPPGVSQNDHGTNGPLPTSGPFYVLAPTGRGQTHYRFAGEVDVFEAIADARRRFDIDPNRIYISGGSMGGTGAAYLPFRNPGVFAASGAFAGYHDQRVRNDTRQQDLNAWERFLVAERSDVDWAENAEHLPMLLIRGTRDKPLAWTRSLVDRLRTLHFNIEHREPVSGHNVWSELFKDPSGFQWFLRQPRLTQLPDRYRFVTASERHGDAYHLRDVRRDAPDVFARIEVERNGRQDRIAFRTEHVRSFVVTGEWSSTLTIVVDGQTLHRNGGGVIGLVREGETWRVQEPASRGKRRGVSGPIRDVFHEPLVFVYGGANDDERARLQAVARMLANPRGWQVSYPIVDARTFDEAQYPDATFVFVGEASSHAALARRAAQLPIATSADAITLGAQRIAGADLGTAFVFPDPARENKSLLVITGNSVAGIEHATALPDLLPDYVIFDASIEAMRDRFAGSGAGANFLAAGFFDAQWMLR